MGKGHRSEQGTILQQKYRLDHLAARGGMGELWRAEELATGRPVAVKRVFGDRSSDPAQLQRRLEREGRALESIDHPHVIEHVATGVDDVGDPYLVLEWLEGENLYQRQRRNKLKLDEAVHLIGQVLEGLAACHARGVVHRDIKPANIFLCDRGGMHVKLLDFGLALLGEEETRLTRAGDVLGTLHYLSPEQARGAERSDHRSDIYSTGVVLYELITGRQPFRAEKALAVLLKIVTEQPPRPRQFRPDAPVWLEEVVLRAMAREPERRFSSAREMAEGLQAMISQPSSGKVAGSALDAEAMETTLPPWRPYAPEYRLVSLLCFSPDEATLSENELHEARSILERAQALFFRLMGGQFVGVFGLDQTCGDEAIRALTCGLEVRDQLGASARLLVASVHLLYGEGLQLDSEDLDRSLAELQSAAPGELLIDETSHELLRSRVRIAKRGGHRIVKALCGSELGRRPVLGVFTPTVGRATELARALELFRESVAQRQCRGLLLEGPAGSGKTRLCADLVEPLRRGACHLIEVRSSSIRRLTSYGLLAEGISAEAELRSNEDESSRLDALKALVRRNIPAGQQDEVTLFLGEALGLQLSPETMRWSSSSAEHFSSLRVARSNPQVMRSRITEATKQLIAAAAASGPIVLLIEDLHWADDESLLLLTALLEMRDVPLFVLATTRPQASDRRALFDRCERLERLELPPLDDGALHRLFGALLGKIAPAHQERMVRWCDGSPYFAEELVSFLVARKALLFDDGRWRLADESAALELPVSVEGAIQGQLDHLAPGEKELLKQASVFGDIFWQDGLAALGAASPAEMLPALARAALIRPHSSALLPKQRAWSFRHSALRQVAYGLLPIDQRRRLHCRAARWLEQEGEYDPGVLADHYAAAGELIKAAQQFERAGQRALAEGDLRGAAICFEAALEHGVDAPAPDRQRRTWDLVRVSVMRGDPDRAEALLEQLEDEGALREDVHAAEAAFHRGRIALVRSHYDEAQRALNDAVSRFRAARMKDNAFEALHTLFWVVWARGRYEDASSLAERMHREASPARPDHLCSAKLASTFYNITCGDLAAALALSEQAVKHAQQAQQRLREIDALIICGVARELVGDYRAALRALEEAQGLSTRLPTPHHATSLRSSFGRIRFTLGDHDAAIEHYEAAIQHATALGDERALVLARCGAARARTRRRATQDLARAATLTDEAFAQVEGQGTPEEAEALLARCELELARDAPGAALMAGNAAIELLDRLGTHEHLEVEILLAAYRAKERSGDPGAPQVLARACQVLESRGARISLKDARSSYFERVPHNKEARALWQARSR